MNLTNEKRQALIDRLTAFRKGIQSACDANMQNESDELDDIIAQIALAALTAEPAIEVSDDECDVLAAFYAPGTKFYAAPPVAAVVQGENWQQRAEKAEAQLAELEESLNSCLITVAKYSGPEKPAAPVKLPAAITDHESITDVDWMTPRVAAQVYFNKAIAEVLRMSATSDTDAKRRAFIASLADDTAPQQYESLSAGCEAEAFNFADGRSVEIPTWKKDPQ